MRRPALRRTTGLAVAALLLTGCSFKGAASFPLPGGVGGDGYQVKIEFDDVLDLVPQSSVKVNDVTVGSVKKIELSPGGYTALVTVGIEDDVKLPENVTAQLRQTSLLGEKFVSLEAPDAASGELKDGMFIGKDRTRRNADIEEVLGALSLVLNGGSLEQLQVINTELTKALSGREDEVRQFLRQLTGFVGGLDDQKGQIVAALDGLDRLSAKLAASRQTLDVALRDIPQGAAVLADERAQLTRVLSGLSNLGTVATRVIQQTQQATVADLRALQPILTQLAKAGKDLPDALELLTTYPFPRTVALPDGKGGIRGDYANLYVTVDDSVQDLLDNITGGGLPPLPLPKAPTSKAPSGPTTPSPTVPRLPSVPGVPTVASDEGDLLTLLLGGFA